MANILYIENIGGEFNKYKSLIESKFTDVIVFPTKEREDKSLESRAFLLKKLRINNDESFKEITDYYFSKSIDLYIIDISLNSDNDSIGISLLNYLFSNDYLDNNFIVLSGHTFTDAMTNHLHQLKELSVNEETEFVEKGNDDKLIRLIRNKLDQQESNLNPEPVEEVVGNNVKKFEVWEKIKKELRELTPRRGTHWLISFVFFFLILLTLHYGFFGIWELLIKTDGKPETTKLVNIESIFLYLLPLFVIFGFYEYYRQSTGALLNERNSGEYKPEKALISLNNSKNILLTTFLSFALIKGIEIIFFNKETNETTLISIGIFIIILMTFLIISHKPAEK